MAEELHQGDVLMVERVKHPVLVLNICRSHMQTAGNKSGGFLW